MKYLVFFVCYCSLFCVGCKKKEEIQVYLSPEIKEYLDLKSGSFWLMKDSISGRTDSFAVFSNTPYIEREPNGINEEVLIEIRQYRNKLSSQLVGKVTLNLRNAITADLNYEYFPLGGEGDILIPNGINLPLAITHGDFLLHGIVYQNVSIVNLPFGIGKYNKYISSDLYLSKKVSFVKLRFEMQTPFVWEVVSYHTVH